MMRNKSGVTALPGRKAKPTGKILNGVRLSHDRICLDGGRGDGNVSPINGFALSPALVYSKRRM